MDEQTNVDLKQIVANAINHSISQILSHVIDRCVKNALETTKELTLKDYIIEDNSTKLYEAAKAMMTNLTWNLALVTCREPLRSELYEHLEYLLKI